MKPIGKIPLAALLGVTLSIALPAQAGTTDYSHLILLLKDNAASSSSSAATINPPSALQKRFPSIKPLVPPSASRTLEDLQALRRHRLDRYYIADTRHLTVKQAQALALRLKQDPAIEAVDFEPQVEGMHGDNGPPTVASADNDIPDHSPRQHYEFGQQAVPPYMIGGVNALHAWTVPGGKGENVRVISAEIDHWSYEHVDLPRPFLELTVGAVTGAHDTSSAGIIVSRENGYGTTGIVPQAQLGYLQWGTDRLLQLADQLREGDVVQLGVHLNYTPFAAVGCSEKCYMPLEYNRTVRDIIAYLTQEKGVHVVLAAANGNIDLDHPYFNGYFDRNLYDSGSVYAGAVDPKTGLRASFSEYGSRVDLFSWGYSVTTTTWSANLPTTGYTHTFSGTSSANPIIAGVMASLQGVARAHGLGNIAPKALRGILVATGYPPINGNRSEIGVQPDLHAAIQKMLDDHADKPPTGRLALPEDVKSGEAFSAHVYAESPTNKPLAYQWAAAGFTPEAGTQATLHLIAPSVNADTHTSISVTVSDGRHSLTLAENITIKAAPGNGDCNGIPPWDASKTYQVYAEPVAYFGKEYKQNFYNVNKPPDINSGPFGQPWLSGVPCP